MIVTPGAPIHRSIKLQTRAGHCIDNSQELDFSINQEIPDYTKDYKSVTPRNAPNPFYNCFGLTFASSRTMVSQKDIPMIKEDDGYEEIGRDDALPGDVIIYYDDNGEISHSGIIVTKPSNGEFNYPWVVSKWGMLSEVYHLAYVIPEQYKPFSKISYWRITR